MSETVSRSSPHTGTVLAQGRPFWVVDGRAYDFTEWMGRHPGGAVWFQQTEGRDISALLHTYHREPAMLRKVLAKYEIEELSGQEVRPKVNVPPRLSGPLPTPPAPPMHPGSQPSPNDVLPKLGVPPLDRKSVV